MKWFNRLRHWQVFVIVLAVPLIVSIVDVPGPTNAKTVSNLIASILYSIWFWSIGNELGRNGNDRKALKFGVLMFLFSFFMATVILEGEGYLRIAFAVLTYLFLIPCTFVVGRWLSLAESQTGKHFHPILNGLLILVFPVGVWIVQPQINLVVKSSSSR